MAASGVLYLLAPPRLQEQLHELGYPLYFLRMLGVAKLLGVGGLLVPRPTLSSWLSWRGVAAFLLDAIQLHRYERQVVGICH